MLVPVKEEENMLGELEQTYHLEKIFRTDRRSCDTVSYTHLDVYKRQAVEEKEK